MTNKNSWDYKIGFDFYATEVDDETYEFTNLLECVEYKLNNTLSDEPIEDCFPMTIGAGAAEHSSTAWLIDGVAMNLADQYLENCTHPSDHVYEFWTEMRSRGLWADIRLDTLDKDERAVISALQSLEEALSPFALRRLETEEIEITLEEIKQHAPELLVSND